jgi:uncharacterized protein YbaR (Trm112 family)
MHLLLTDRLCCPRCGPDFGLILLADRIDDRRVFEGRFGCANCRDAFPVDAGFGDLRPPPRERMGEAPPGLDDASEEDVVRLGALLGVTEGQGHVALLGGTLDHAAPLADLLDGVEIVAVGEGLRGALERAGVSRLMVGARLPFFSRSLRAVALDESAHSLIVEAVRVTAPGGRVVVLDADSFAREALESTDTTVVLDGEGVLVGIRGPAPGRDRGSGVSLPIVPGTAAPDG